MRITYRDGEALILAEADQLIAKGATLTAVLRDGTALNFPFASQEVLEDFFRTVILPAGETPAPAGVHRLRPPAGGTAGRLGRAVRMTV